MITTPRLHHFARLTFTGLVTASLTLAVATTPAVFADDIAITPVPGDGAGQHWPRWRGPSGQGVVPDGNYPDQWSETDTMGVVTCYEAATGELVWRERLPAETTGEAYSASPVGVDGRVYFSRDSGETFVLRAGPEFEVMQVNQVGEPMLASPALLDGRWYMRTRRHLMCVGR